MAEENPSWGYARIQGALRHLDHRVARSTIAKVLKEHGQEPSPDRPMSWATFVRSHARLIAAAGFFVTAVWSVRGLVRHFTLFFVDIATRRVHIAGTTTSPNAVFSPRFKAILGSSGVEILMTAYQAPNMNAHAEYVAHYHEERSHQGLGNRIPSGVPVQRGGLIRASERLGGLLSSGTITGGRREWGQLESSSRTPRAHTLGARRLDPRSKALTDLQCLQFGGGSARKGRPT